MTRVRFTSGRKLRAGAHTAKDRLEHTHPDVIELFHTKQAFLTVSTCTKWTNLIIIITVKVCCKCCHSLILNSDIMSQ